MTFTRTRTLGALVAWALSLPAFAADLPLPPPVPLPPVELPAFTAFFVHLGPAGLIPDEGAKIRAGGFRIPGATIKIDPHVTASLEAGYYFTPNFAIAVSAGVPPEPTIQGAGTVAPYGKLGSILYGPSAVTAQYHFTNFGMFQPYVGIGPLYMFVFKEHDGALSNFRVDGAWGGVIQGGVDVMLTRNWGVFFDVKKAYLRTEAKGNLGFIPIKADVRLDPVVLSGGVTYRF